MLKKILIVFFVTIALYAQANVDSTKSEEQSIFPLWKSLLDNAEELGYKFPQPYGLSVSVFQQLNKMQIKSIVLGDIEINDNSDIIRIDDSSIENTVYTSQARFDLWVLPFLNLYGMYGKVTTFNDIELKFNLSIPPIPGLTEGDIKEFESKEIATLNGDVLAWGGILAFGYQRIFVNLNLTYAKTYLDELNSSQESFVAFPSIGLQTNFANFFVGAIYQNVGQKNSGSFVGSSGKITNYSVEYNADLWNYVIGMNKEINRYWTINLFQGFGKRINSAIEVGYRFSW